MIDAVRTSSGYPMRYVTASIKTKSTPLTPMAGRVFCFACTNDNRSETVVVCDDGYDDAWRGLHPNPSLFKTSVTGTDAINRQHICRHGFTDQHGFMNIVPVQNHSCHPITLSPQLYRDIPRPSQKFHSLKNIVFHHSRIPQHKR